MKQKTELINPKNRKKKLTQKEICPIVPSDEDTIRHSMGYIETQEICYTFNEFQVTQN
jgi:hypothetical protein